MDEHSALSMDSTPDVLELLGINPNSAKPYIDETSLDKINAAYQPVETDFFLEELLQKKEENHDLDMFLDQPQEDISISLPEIQVDLKDINIDPTLQNNNLIANKSYAIDNIVSKPEVQDEPEVQNKFEDLKEFLTFKTPRRISKTNNNLSSKNNKATNKLPHTPNHINGKLIGKDRTKEFKVPRGFQDTSNLKQRQNVINDFVHISDRIVQPRAVAVLPSILHIKHDVISPIQLLPPRVRFGPVQGIKRVITKPEVRDIVADSAAMKRPVFFLGDNNGEITHIDISDKDKTNWLCLLPIGQYDTANVWLYEDNNELYGFTTKPIPPKNPLTLGYSKAYADKYKIPTFQPILDLKAYAYIAKKWMCNECNRSFSSAAIMQRHFDFYHKNDKPEPWRRYSRKQCTNFNNKGYTSKRQVEITCEKRGEVEEIHAKGVVAKNKIIIEKLAPPLKRQVEVTCEKPEEVEEIDVKGFAAKAKNTIEEEKQLQDTVMNLVEMEEDIIRNSERAAKTMEIPKVVIQSSLNVVKAMEIHQDIISNQSKVGKSMDIHQDLISSPLNVVKPMEIHQDIISNPSNVGKSMDIHQDLISSPLNVGKSMEIHQDIVSSPLNVGKSMEIHQDIISSPLNVVKPLETQKDMTSRPFKTVQPMDIQKDTITSSLNDVKPMKVKKDIISSSLNVVKSMEISKDIRKSFNVNKPMQMPKDIIRSITPIVEGELNDYDDFEYIEKFRTSLNSSTNLLHSDRLSDYELSNTSRPDSELYNYDIQDKDENSLINDVEFMKFSENLISNDVNDIDKSRPKVVVSCVHCDQGIIVKKTRRRQCESKRRRMQCKCGKVFISKRKFIQHNYKEHRKDSVDSKKTSKPEKKSPEIYKYECEQCRITFKRRGMLVNHLWFVHNTRNAVVPLERRVKHYYCVVCPKMYVTAAKRNRHVRLHHPGVEKMGAQYVDGGVVKCEPAACSACPRQYATRAKLLQHMRRHHPHLAPPIKKKSKITLRIEIESKV